MGNNPVVFTIVRRRSGRTFHKEWIAWSTLVHEGAPMTADLEVVALLFSVGTFRNFDLADDVFVDHIFYMLLDCRKHYLRSSDGEVNVVVHVSVVDN